MTTTAQKQTTARNTPRRPASTKTSGTKQGTSEATSSTTTPEVTIQELETTLVKIQTESAGLKDTDPGAARLAAEAVALMQRIDRIKQQLEDEDPARRKATVMELEKVNDRVTDLFGEHATRITDMELTLDSHTGILAEHDVEINNTKQRITDIEAMAKIPFGKLVIAAVIAVIIWIVASLIWGSINHSPAPVVLADGTKVMQHSPLNDPFFAFVFGFIPAAIFFALFLLFARKRVAEEQTKISTEKKARRTLRGSFQRNRKASAAQSVPPVPTKETMDADNTPTKVVETSSGATSTRS